ncbi:type II secretion system protein GspL [Marinobacter vulgaris]|uniref:Type II secretion system protein L n=1 Tax=Marinobacter vulgaris TaxID=1928331 RepID=A0A2V3ZLT4_9GAMM|nr:type II secretion system protein GspL [Marinobacter vulgaris]PXX91772.1 type II secretion system protein GspL [Marinobacter vulgaris]TSJ70719.1 type II secretion system protein GspL [Marinobacter vulgaris]
MSYRLYVRPLQPFAVPDATPEAQLYNWVLLDASGDAQARGTADRREDIEQTLAQNDLESVRLVGLIPGEEALFCLADIPARQTRFVHQALPYAVEEQIAQDIESVHLALGNRTEKGFRVAAVDHNRMAEWVAMFSGWAYLKLEAIYPDAGLLPLTEGGWSICLDGETIMLASDQGEWLSVQARNLTMFTQTLALPPSDDVVVEVPVTVYGTEQEFEHQQPDLVELKSSARLTVREQILELMPLELLAHAHHHHLCQPINLCQGEYSIRTRKSGTLGPWKPLLAVASVWFVIQIGVEVGMGLYHQQKADQTREQAMAIYRQAFPDDSRTHAGNVRRVVEGQLRQMQTDGPDAGFITLMKYTGEQYSRIPDTGSVMFNSVNYSSNRGELVVDVRADSYGKLSTLRNGLTSRGLRAEIGSVVNESDGARGRLTVSGG